MSLACGLLISWSEWTQNLQNYTYLISDGALGWPLEELSASS